MTDRAEYGLRSGLYSFLRSPWGWRVGFVLLLALGAPRIARQVRTGFCRPAGGVIGSYSYDFDLTMGFIDQFVKTGVLYDTTGVDPYGPITSSMLKYPPLTRRS